MREFLDKLQEDQRRMRKYLRAHALHFKRMGEVLARTRKHSARVFVIGEPPLHGVATIVAEEYFTFLPALAIDLAKPVAASIDPEDEPPIGPRDAAARQAVRHFHRGDVLLAFLLDGSDRETRVVLEGARAKRLKVLIVAGLGAKSGHNKRIAKVLLALPTRGVKTVCESVFTCARILARVSRAAWRGAASEAEEVRLIQVVCDSCSERVFFEEGQRGRKADCPLCEAGMRIPKESGRRAALVAEEPSDVSSVALARLPARRSKLKPSVLELPTLDAEDLESDDEAAVVDESLEAPVGLVSQPVGVAGPSFGSDIVVGSGVVSAVPEESETQNEVTTVTASADPFALEDGFLDDLQMPRTNTPAPGANSSAPHEEDLPSRRVSARYTISQCRIRWGRGGYPDDTSPEHEMILLGSSRLAFILNPDDEAGETLQAGDELYVRIQIPAFLEPILVRASLQEITGTSGIGGGARAELLFQDVEAKVRRKLDRASDNLGAHA